MGAVKKMGITMQQVGALLALHHRALSLVMIACGCSTFALLLLSGTSAPYGR
jgi:hypothetical protein